MPRRPPNLDVFVNCPFDSDFEPIFNAIVFTVTRCGFRARCAREADDGAQNRLEKICQIINESRYGVHDISRTESGGEPPLPRFNMPLELGMFLGVRLLGSRSHQAKRCIIFDTHLHRYQAFISDIAGQDIHAHAGQPSRVIRELAGWLRAQRPGMKIPGGAAIAAEYASFNAQLPAICVARELEPSELTFGDYTAIIVQYLKLAAA